MIQQFLSWVYIQNKQKNNSGRPQGGRRSFFTGRPDILGDQGQDCLTPGLFTHGGATVLGQLILWFCEKGQPSLTHLCKAAAQIAGLHRLEKEMATHSSIPCW